ncbi:hypothetical protein CMQ_4723 [Grosmannia clavigera kw1407]|uniref:Uncharacterized protein n=1 Tax=Grosmannia clavigera (strain kw1407 / UAMH 11150) TaxID=655863 RepID=F0XU44_GROCL|nr:uncharacterized protein CMQ_4723 [Grosmannia clavigera kw1407]EFW98871.1 hypothetical protein CMQ_4723 [Grosmannia clavigera kw1407]
MAVLLLLPAVSSKAYRTRKNWELRCILFRGKLRVGTTEAEAKSSSSSGVSDSLDLKEKERRRNRRRYDEDR